MAKGRTLNPADAHRKAERKKEIKKNKAVRTKTREVVTLKKDTGGLEADIRRLEETERDGELDKNNKAKLSSLKAELERIKKTKSEYVAEHPEHRKLVFPGGEGSSGSGGPREPRVQGATRNVFGPNGLPIHPERSIYYDEIMNPFGMPPPGMPYVERPLLPHEMPPVEETAPASDESGDDSDSDEEDIPLPPGPPPLPIGNPPGTNNSDIDSDSDDDIPLPPGPPPSQVPFPPAPPLPSQPPALHHLVIPPPPPGAPPLAFSGSFPPVLPQGAFIPPPPPLPAGFSYPPLPPPPGFAYAPPFNPAYPPPPQFLNSRPRAPQQRHQDPLSSEPHQPYQHHRMPQQSTLPPLPPSAPLPPLPPPKPQHVATISAAPELRDLKREATAFIPSAVKRRKANTGGVSRINATPGNADVDASPGGDHGVPVPQAPDLMATLRNAGVGGKLKEKQKDTEKKKDDYDAFLAEMGDIL